MVEPRAIEGIRALFQERPETVGPLSWIGAAAALVAGTAASLLRQRPVPAWDTVWAEDAAILLSDAVNLRFLDALRTPVAGYFLTLPRVLAEPLAWLPADWAAAAIAFEAALMTSLLALFVYAASGAHLRHPLARIAAAAVCVVTPVGAGDVPNALSNLHWAGAYATAWALLYVPSTRTGALVGAALALAMAATNVVLVALLPLALVRFAWGPRGRGRLVCGALALGLLAQLGGALTGAAATRSIPTRPDPVGAFTDFFARTVPRSLLGERLAGPDVAPFALALAWAILLAVCGLAVRYARPDLPLASLLAGQAFVFWMVAAGATGLRPGRYEATVCMFLTAALAALAQPVDGEGGTRPLVTLAVALAVVWMVSYGMPTVRGLGPRWSSGLQQARSRCGSAGRAQVEVAVAPRDGGWSARLPCDYVR